MNDPDTQPAAPSIALPVMQPNTTRPRSKMGKRRAAVLIAIHIAIAAHILHWKIAGSTISPVEPSEAMQTLELGRVNAGFIFLLAALLCTLIFGRFFCGWGCHIVALQDFCGWTMKKMGVRPKPFRTRLLIYAPLVLAFYMFFWPTLRRLVTTQTTIIQDGFTNHTTTTDFWETFASVAVAAPFLVVCGFLCVYFLGSKGFCTYGCPYGGLFGPIDKVAFGRIVVDKSKCKGTGHCTAACTSNVRVSEEVREYGRVTDPGCMKCLDCVSVCPNGALSWQLSPPPLFSKHSKSKRIKPKYDTSIPEEITLAILSVAIFFATRGAYAVVPMLMAVGISASLTFMAWKAWRTLREPNARIAFIQLKIKDQLKPAGAAFLAVTAALLALTAHTGFINYHRWRGGELFQSTEISLAQALSQQPPPIDGPTHARVEQALDHLMTAGAISDGGLALAWHPESRLQAAHLSLALGNPAQSAMLLSPLIESHHASDRLCADYARVLILAGDRPKAQQFLQETLANNAGFWESRQEFLSQFADAITLTEILESTEEAAKTIAKTAPGSDSQVQTLLILARLHETARNSPAAIAAYQAASEAMPGHPGAHENLAAALLRLNGDTAGAIIHLEICTTLDPTNTRAWSYLSQLHHQMGDTDAMLKACDGAINSVTTNAEREQTTRNVAMMLIQLGYEQQGNAYVDRADALRSGLDK